MLSMSMLKTAGGVVGGGVVGYGIGYAVGRWVTQNPNCHCEEPPCPTGICYETILGAIGGAIAGGVIASQL